MTPEQRIKSGEQLARRMERAGAHRAGEEPPPILAEMSITTIDMPDGKALGALLRNSLAADEDAPQRQVNVKLAGVGFSLERDGCDYVHMGLRFLHHFGCPPECRLFVLALCALSGGDAHSFHVTPDVKIGELLGYERHAVRPIREALIEWQRNTNYAFVDIIEGDYDRAKKQHVATQYRTRIVPLIGRYVRRARAMGMRSEQAAIRQAAENGFNDEVDEIAKDVPTAPLVRRREVQRGAKSKPQVERQIEMVYAQRDRCREQTEGMFGNLMMAGQNPWPVWEALAEELTTALERLTKDHPRFKRE